MFDSGSYEIRSSILLGLLRPGDRLPPVRELGARLGISLHTVRKAYSVLDEHGVVSGRPGAGTIVRDSPSNEGILQRDELLRELALRALRTANRHGYGVDELVAALRRADTALSPAAWIAPPEFD